MITYLHGAPKVYSPNATITNQTVISKMIRAGEVFEYAHTDTIRAMVRLELTATNATVVRLQIVANNVDPTRHSIPMLPWKMSEVGFYVLRGQVLNIETASDVNVRLLILGEAS